MSVCCSRLLKESSKGPLKARSFSCTWEVQTERGRRNKTEFLPLFCHDQSIVFSVIGQIFSSTRKLQSSLPSFFPFAFVSSHLKAWLSWDEGSIASTSDGWRGSAPGSVQPGGRAVASYITTGSMQASECRATADVVARLVRHGPTGRKPAAAPPGRRRRHGTLTQTRYRAGATPNFPAGGFGAA